jgi:hypothetical protein
VLLVDAVEESANVTLPAEIASGELYGMTLGCHISPHIHSRHETESTIANAYRMFTAIAARKSALHTLKFGCRKSANPGAIAIDISART